MNIDSTDIRHYRLPLDPPFLAAWDPQPRTSHTSTLVRVRAGAYAGVGSGDVNQSMKAVMPARATSETHERSSGPSSRNQGRVSSIRLVAAVVSSPVARVSRAISGRARGGGTGGR